MSLLRKYMLVIFLMSQAMFCLGQQKDFVGLTGISASKFINRSWDFGLATQTMFNQNLSELWIGYGDISLGYKIRRNLSIELHYRIIRFRNLDNHYDNRNMMYNTITCNKSLGKFNFSVRNRIQQLVYGEYFEDHWREPRWYNRIKFSTRYRFNYYWSLVASGEFFQPLNHPTRSGMDQYRLSAGLSYQYSDFLRFEPYFQLQQQRLRAVNNSNFVLGINALIKIP